MVVIVIVVIVPLVLAGPVALIVVAEAVAASVDVCDDVGDVELVVVATLIVRIVMVAELEVSGDGREVASVDVTARDTIIIVMVVTVMMGGVVFGVAVGVAIRDDANVPSRPEPIASGFAELVGLE